MSKIVSNSEADSTGGRWLVDVLREARRRRMCTRIYCTTCGHQDFWDLVLSSATLNASVPEDDADRRETLQFELASLGDKIRAISQSLARGLDALTEQDVREYTEELRTVLFASQAAQLNTVSLLRNGPARSVHSAMQRHASDVVEQRRQSEKKLDLEKRQRLQEAELRRQRRQQEKLERDRKRREALDVLANLHEAERLTQIIAGASSLALAAIPSELIPKSGLSTLDPQAQAWLRKSAARLKAWRQMLRNEGV
jgi:hypothetical protein